MIDRAQLLACRTRDDVDTHLRSWGVADCLELGVRVGIHLRKILRGRALGGTVYAVDHWRADVPVSENDGKAAQDTLDVQYARIARLADPGLVVLRIHGAAIPAHLPPPPCLDFVYIDADHTEAAVARDLEQLYPYVRPGGLFGGHDYMNRGGKLRVQAAVDAFCAHHALTLDRVTPEVAPSWYLVKPGV